MINHINKVEIPCHLQNLITDLFDKIDASGLLEEDVWIAGGFARIISNNFKNDISVACKEFYNYFYSNGDIDIFCSNIDIVNEYAKNLKDICEENRIKRFSKLIDWTSLDQKENFIENNFYENIFSYNYEKSLGVYRNYCLEFNTKFDESDYYRYSSIKIQLVNKFIFKNIKECFDSFDLSNSKFAVKKEKDKYYLYYTDKSEFYCKNNLLNIERISSPYLTNRILKYVKKYKFNIDNTKHFRKHIEDYLYKIILDDWNDYFKNTFIAESVVKSLHETVTLTDKELCLFIGKFNHVLKKPDSSSYGSSFSKNVDWAAHHIGLLNG